MTAPFVALGPVDAVTITTLFDNVEERQPSFLLDPSILLTGEVDRSTGYEPGFPPREKHEHGAWVPDQLVLDDQAVVMHVRDRGLLMMTGRGHAGVINIVRYARKLTGVERVYAVIGGFHLGGHSFEPIISDVCAALVELAPEVNLPVHCTGRGQRTRSLPRCRTPSSRTASVRGSSLARRSDAHPTDHDGTSLHLGCDQ
ncbi:MAG: MBL fold metallo-hydrolase [Chloroflexi bacterium]|nr:MBL fold metallo-hydrolase [Chloroflexota bacterium]